MAISVFMLLLLFSMIRSIRLLAGIIAAGMFVMLVLRGLREMRGVYSAGPGAFGTAATTAVDLA